MKTACCLFINIETRERKAYKFVQYYKSLQKNIVGIYKIFT